MRRATVVAAGLAGLVMLVSASARAEDASALSTPVAPAEAPAEESSNWFPDAPPAPPPVDQPAPDAAQPAAVAPAPAVAPPPVVIASPAESPPVEASRMVTRAYGWKIALIDGLSVLTLVASGAAESSSLAGLAVGGYLLGGPIVHFAHGNVGRGFGSFGLRVGAPFVGAAFGAAVADCDGDGYYCPLGQVAVGFLVGVVGAMVVDAAALARDKVVRPSVAGGWYPSLTVSKQRADLTLMGHF